MAADDQIFCPQCGYNLFGIPEHRCPECGYGYDHAAIRDLSEKYTSGELEVYRRVTLLSIVATGVAIILSLPLSSSPLPWGGLIFVSILVHYATRDCERGTVLLAWFLVFLLWLNLMGAAREALWMVWVLPISCVYWLIRLSRAPRFVSLSVPREKQWQLRAATVAAYASLGLSIVVLVYLV